ncbi:hypothetical protein L195_g048391, partial [Trifolium pratense]
KENLEEFVSVCGGRRLKCGGVFREVEYDTPPRVKQQQQ